MKLDLRVVIGDFQENRLVDAEFDEKGDAFAVVSLSTSDLARHWFPGAKVLVRSVHEHDEVEVLCYDHSLQPLEESDDRGSKIPSVFEVRRRMN